MQFMLDESRQTEIVGQKFELVTVIFISVVILLFFIVLLLKNKISWYYSSLLKRDYK